MIDLCRFLEAGECSAHIKTIRRDEPLSTHSTFKVGGSADFWIQPDLSGGVESLAFLLRFAKEEGIPVCILGRGANILFKDEGFRGIALDMGGWTGIDGFNKETGRVSFRSGTRIDAAVEELARKSFGAPPPDAESRGALGALAEIRMGGLEFLAGMPGTIGGAVYMNARCYDKAIADVFVSATLLDERLELITIPFRDEDWAYKKSPFQNKEYLIVSAEFGLCREREESRLEMEKYRQDRENKGHYRYPSAGSVFKNNRAFGKPTGKIIDELGLRGMARGGAMIAPFHGNIIINTGGATSADVRFLIDRVMETARRSLGFELEPEIVFK
jgi:UDP-N-acetylmuramate dehydrogenase